MIVRKAVRSDLPAVDAIYGEIHTQEEAGAVTTGWKRGVYPVMDTARNALERGDLFVLDADGAVLGAGIINQIQMDVYAGAPWAYSVPDRLVCVLHTLVISPSAGQKGLGTFFIRFYEEYARSHGFPELRIDTNARNLRARSLYRRLGYREIDIVPTVFNGLPDVDLVLLEKTLDLPAEEK